MGGRLSHICWAVIWKREQTEGVGALRRQLEDSGRQVSRSLIETFPQALHWRVWCLCLCDNECVKCVRACLCE